MSTANPFADAPAKHYHQPVRGRKTYQQSMVSCEALPSPVQSQCRAARGAISSGLLACESYSVASSASRSGFASTWIWMIHLSFCFSAFSSASKNTAMKRRRLQVILPLNVIFDGCPDVFRDQGRIGWLQSTTVKGGS